MFILEAVLGKVFEQDSSVRRKVYQENPMTSLLSPNTNLGDRTTTLKPIQ